VRYVQVDYGEEAVLRELLEEVFRAGGQAHYRGTRRFFMIYVVMNEDKLSL
jgi:hypothetical protein